MVIRKAKIEDAKSLNWLLTLLIRDEEKYDKTINKDFVVTNMYENYIQDPSRFLYLAEEDNEIVGYLYGYIKEDITIADKKSFLDALYVEEDYRKKGIANSLIEEFKNWSKDNGTFAIEVNVCSDNIKAKNLYKKHGFIPTKETLNYEIK